MGQKRAQVNHYSHDLEDAMHVLAFWQRELLENNVVLIKLLITKMVSCTGFPIFSCQCEVKKKKCQISENVG